MRSRRSLAEAAGRMAGQQEPAPAELAEGAARHAQQIVDDAGPDLPAHEESST